MNKIGLIIRREYITRVRNKTFILLTLLAPIFYGILLLMPLLASSIGKETREVQVIDKSGKFSELQSNNTVVFTWPSKSFEQLKKEISRPENNSYILYIPDSFNIFHPSGIELISRKNVGTTFKSHIDSILSGKITELKMNALSISPQRIDSLKTSVDVVLRKSTAEGLKESSSGATTIASFIGGFLIYIFIFLYGSLVLRGVQEEKQSRVIEIIISSVRPFQLMMGKIIGIALVGLTQFLIWVVLTLAFTAIFGNLVMMVQHVGGPMASQGAGAQVAFNTAASALNTLPVGLLIGMFIFFFIGGYLLYSSLFAGFASAVDSQADIYQFMFPVSLPIVFSITLIPAIIENPDSHAAIIFSLIPFTSPVIMMARLPFEVPVWQLLTSMALLILGFLLTTWIAAKIYRTGILLYGKKITYKELTKWVFY